MAMGQRDPRTHRQPQSRTTDSDLAGALFQNSQGRVDIALDGPLFVNPRNRLDVRVDDGLEVASGSPMSIKLRIDDDSIQLNHRGEAVARPKASQVTNDSGAGTAGQSLADTLEGLSERQETVGYVAGATSAAQLVSKATGVSSDGACGQVTLDASPLASMTSVAFTVTCAACTKYDTPCVSIQGGATAGSYLVSVGQVADGSFSITLFNCSGGGLSEALILNYCILSGVSA